MAYTAEAIEAIEEFQRWLNDGVDSIEDDFIASWDRAWSEVSPQWSKIANELAKEEKWPSRMTLLGNASVMAALRSTARVLSAQERTGVAYMDGELPGAVEGAAKAEDAMITAQLPQKLREAVAVREAAAGGRAIDAIISRAAVGITSLMAVMPEDVYAKMVAFLVEGVSLGRNPRTVARSILKGMEGKFYWGLNRALTISRTEMLDAMRQAQKATDRNNKDLLEGWRWTTTLDTRTCPSCMAMDGRVFDISVSGPDDHQNGRCARVPKTKTWRELGLDIDEPKDLIPNARQWFDGLPEGSKLQIMGKGRLELLTNGEIGWDDLSTFVPNSNWRGSYRPTPVRDLTRKANR